MFAMVDDVAAAGVDHVALLVIPNHHSKAPIGENPKFCDWLRKRRRCMKLCCMDTFTVVPQRRRMVGHLVTEHYTAR